MCGDFFYPWRWPTPESGFPVSQGTPFPAGLTRHSPCGCRWEAGVATSWVQAGAPGIQQDLALSGSLSSKQSFSPQRDSSLFTGHCGLQAEDSCKYSARASAPQTSCDSALPFSPPSLISLFLGLHASDPTWLPDLLHASPWVAQSHSWRGSKLKIYAFMRHSVSPLSAAALKKAACKERRGSLGSVRGLRRTGLRG